MTEERLVTQLRAVDNVAIVEVTGEIDLATIQILREALRAATDTAPNVIVDLSAVPYMDSSGFGTLLGATKRLRPAGGHLYLVGCNAAMLRMLEITRLNSVLFSYDSVAAAQQAIVTQVSAAATATAEG